MGRPINHATFFAAIEGVQTQGARNMFRVEFALARVIGAFRHVL
jgi:hypothetical protein